MGNAVSTDPELVKLQKRFSPEELEELRHLFLSLAAQSRTGGTHIIASVFQTYFGIHGVLGNRLFDYMAQDDNDGLISFEEFIAAKAVVDKGSDEELEHFIFAISDVLCTGNVTRLEAGAVVASALLTVFGPARACLSEELMAAFISSAHFKGPQTSLEKHPLCRQCSGWSNHGLKRNGGEAHLLNTSDKKGILDTGMDFSLFRVDSASSTEEGGSSERDSSNHGSDNFGPAGDSTGRSEAASAEEIEERMDDLWSGSSESLSIVGEGLSATAAEGSRQDPSGAVQSSGFPAGDQGEDVEGQDRAVYGKTVAACPTREMRGNAPSGRGRLVPVRVQSEPTIAHEGRALRRDTSMGVHEGGRECMGECGRHPSMTERDFREWMERVPVLKKFLRSLLAPPAISRTLPGRLVPVLTWPEAAKGNLQRGASFKKGGRFLMRDELAWHLSGMLKEREAEGPWRMAYSSSLHGLSFSTFMGKVAEIPLPGALLVRDKGGAVFGAVFSQALQRKSTFYGDMKTFLFSFLPTVAIFKPCGVNQNIQWCATGFTSESIPNGVGFGGQIGHFGLFMDSTFDKGQAWPSMTFRSPSLATQPLFDVDVVECWSLGQPEEDEEASSTTKKPQLKGTILERFKEEKALLGFAGMATATDTLSKDDTS